MNIAKFRAVSPENKTLDQAQRDADSAIKIYLNKIGLLSGSLSLLKVTLFDFEYYSHTRSQASNLHYKELR
jgi:hypothetical protein